MRFGGIHVSYDIQQQQKMEKQLVEVSHGNICGCCFELMFYLHMILFGTCCDRITTWTPSTFQISRKPFVQSRSRHTEIFVHF